MLREQYHIDIPEDDAYQTLAGYILTSTGIIPQQGDVMTLDGLEMTILKRTASRLELISLRKADTKD